MDFKLTNTFGRTRDTTEIYTNQRRIKWHKNEQNAKWGRHNVYILPGNIRLIKTREDEIGDALCPQQRDKKFVLKNLFTTRFTKRHRKFTLLIHFFAMILSQMYSFVTECSLTMAFTGLNTYNHYHKMTFIILCAISWKYCICLMNS
jgi:hypothetical protein